MQICKINGFSHVSAIKGVSNVRNMRRVYKRQHRFVLITIIGIAVSGIIFDLKPQFLPIRTDKGTKF